jgi:hypothetical protein
MKTFLWGVLTGALLLSTIAGFVVVKNNAAAKQRILTANVAAEHFQIAYGEIAKAYEERAFSITSQKEMINQLEAENEELAGVVRDRDARILSLVRTEARLEAELDSSASVVAQTDSATYRVDLDESVVLDSGGYINVSGTVSINVVGPTVRTALGVRGSLPLSIVITEQPDGQLAVFAYTGDDRLTISNLDVSTVPAATAQSGLFDAIGRALSSPAPWIGAAAGFLGCLAVTGAF